MALVVSCEPLCHTNPEMHAGGRWNMLCIISTDVSGTVHVTRFIYQCSQSDSRDQLITLSITKKQVCFLKTWAC